MREALKIAFYLPQFHPTKENDEWWGKGFTEWRNVASAKPLFRNHYQPHIPADLGFYDLRVPETRDEQSELAMKYGIDAFCYWHYWFGGRTILERPFEEVVSSGNPKIKFCVAWANETWSGVWHGKSKKVLIEQTYQGEQDYINHFYYLLPAFKDNRYVKIDGKPLVYVYLPLSIPDTELFFNTWKKLAIKNGFEGLFFVGGVYDRTQYLKVMELGYDAANRVGYKNVLLTKEHIAKGAWNVFCEKMFNGKFRLPKYKFSSIYTDSVYCEDVDKNEYPTVVSGWDNSPRSGKRGLILTDYTPEEFKRHCKKIKHISEERNDRKIIFVRAWNEWAEGNHLEPDLKYGHKFLEVFKSIFGKK